MTHLRLPLALLALSVAALASAQSPYLSYEFNGSLAPTTGTGPSLVGNGGTVDADTYDFAAGQGLSLASTALDSTTTYTIHLGFSFSDVAGFNKILDFKDRTTDQGLYIRDGLLNFFGAVEGGPSTVDNQFRQVTLVRDGGTQLVSAYLDGGLAFSFTDSGNLGALTGANLVLFRDDVVQNFEQSGGSAEFVRFYSGALNDAQVQAISNPVPEPATMAALGLGAVALLRRRRKA